MDFMELSCIFFINIQIILQNEMCIRDRMSTLADANKSVEEAAKAENSNTEDTTTKNNTDKSEKTQESAGAAAEETDLSLIHILRHRG